MFAAAFAPALLPALVFKGDAAGLSSLARLLGHPSPGVMLESRYGEVAGVLMGLSARLPAALGSLRDKRITDLLPLDAQVCAGNSVCSWVRCACYRLHVLQTLPCPLIL